MTPYGQKTRMTVLNRTLVGLRPTCAEGFQPKGSRSLGSVNSVCGDFVVRRRCRRADVLGIDGLKG
jgi:hypothetical protein